MFNRISIVIVFSMASLLANAAVAGDKATDAAKQWPAWRGPLATGEAPKSDPPTEWSEKKNVRWKIEIPGRGHATPIVWGDRVYVQTAVEMKETPKDASPEEAPLAPHDSGLSTGEDMQPEGPRGPRGPGGPGGPGGRRGFGRGKQAAPKSPFEFRVLALDRKTGKTIWDTKVHEGKVHEGGHPDASQASNSPVTDGEHIYAYFGSRGLHCLSMDGKVQWSAELGKMQTRNEFGEGSSPALYGDTIVISWDHEGDDFIVAFDKKTGKEKWRVDRDEHTTWATPIVVEANGKPQVVASATNFIRAYDLATGKEVWKCSGMTDNVIPSPMVSGGLLYAISGFRGAALLAIKYANAKGDISDGDAIAWKYGQDTPYVPSALLMNDRIYFVENTKPIMSCLDAKTGKPLYDKTRLKGIDGIYSSIVGAGGHVYIVGRNGTTLVLKDGPEFSEDTIKTNKLDEGFDASPAIAGDELFLRGHSHLYCIAAK
jgi:outer membrane protein assembly factor BamB